LHVAGECVEHLARIAAAIEPAQEARLGQREAGGLGLQRVGAADQAKRLLRITAGEGTGLVLEPRDLAATGPGEEGALTEAGEGAGDGLRLERQALEVGLPLADERVEGAAVAALEVAVAIERAQ